MTATNHTVTGALILAVLPNHWLGLLLALFSHVVLDALPHFGVQVAKLKLFIPILLSDMIIAASVLLGLAAMGPADRWWLIAGGIVAASPDLLSIPYFLDVLRHKEHHFGRVQQFLGWIQWSETPKGLVIELLWLMLVGRQLLVAVA